MSVARSHVDSRETGQRDKRSDQERLETLVHSHLDEE